MTRLEAKDGSSYPGNWALGVVDDVELTRAVAGAMAADLAGAGVNLDFAPVADVNTTADNPIIGVRSFGSDAELVARHVAAFVEGLEARRRRRVRQALPGARRHAARTRTWSCRRSTRCGRRRCSRSARRSTPACSAIMTAHIRVREVGDEPATLSRGAAQRLAARRARLLGRGDHRRPGDEGDQRDRRRGAGSRPGTGRRRRCALPGTRSRRRLGRADRPRVAVAVQSGRSRRNGWPKRLHASPGQSIEQRQAARADHAVGAEPPGGPCTRKARCS